ncbi:MAG: WXG100 family type VII secretion target [Bifidobacteriaceae bacterium]|jgi:WXG100 family type VII secretion target|nr:WXG100 family type VII secretion target [Bifidobacteriaceae bacterium]
MANDKISVLEDALRKGAEAVHDAKERTDSELKGIASLVDELGSYWTGPAARSYVAMQTQFGETSRKLNNVLLTLEDSLRSTDRAQQAYEESTSSTASGVLGSLQEM